MLPPPDDTAHPLALDFQDLIRHRPFPCVGAKSALARGGAFSRGGMNLLVARGIDTTSDDDRIYAALLALICRYRQPPELFWSFAVLFDSDAPGAEEAFETSLWTRIQSPADRDGRLGQRHDPRIAEDPEAPAFSVSLGGEGVFIVDLNPAASRPAQRFAAPTLVFNLHDQFQRLRAEGRYERLRDGIVARDVAFAGSPNPMLAQHGERPAARQFGGRTIPDDWACPFSRRSGPSAWDGSEGLTTMRTGAFVADNREV